MNYSIIHAPYHYYFITKNMTFHLRNTSDFISICKRFNIIHFTNRDTHLPFNIPNLGTKLPNASMKISLQVQKCTYLVIQQLSFTEYMQTLTYTIMWWYFPRQNSQYCIFRTFAKCVIIFPGLSNIYRVYGVYFHIIHIYTCICV